MNLSKRVCFTLVCATLVLYQIKVKINKITVDKIEARRERIVRYECEEPLCGGWADRLKGIMSAYYWSLITDRKFELNMQHPCLLQNILQPNKINWLMHTKSPYHYTHELNKIDDSLFRNETMKMLDLNEYKSKYNVIVIKNNLDWLLSMSENPRLSQKLEQLGFAREKFNAPHLFRKFYQDFFKLDQSIHERFEDFKRKIGSRTLICAQFRVHYALRVNSYRFWSFLNETFVRNVRDYRLFLTTDDESVYREAQDIFPHDKFVSHEGSTYHMDTGESTPDNCTRIEKVVLDFHSLQLCDMAVISDSGFGKLGVYNRIRPDENLFIFKNISNEFLFKKMTIDELVKFDEKF